MKKTVTLSLAYYRDVCGETLTDTPILHTEQRTKIDIVFEKAIEYVDTKVKQCPTCDSIVKDNFSVDMRG